MSGRIFNKFIPPLKLEGASVHPGPKKDTSFILNSGLYKSVVPSKAIAPPGCKNHDKYYEVIYSRLRTKKKAKSEDGVLLLSLKKFELQDSDGKKLIDRPNTHKCIELRNGEILTLGGLNIEVQHEISKEDFVSGRCFFHHLKPQPLRINPNPTVTLSIPEGAFVLDQDKKVFVEPFLAESLRPHQKIGVKFMYECVAGLKGEHIRGCVLADSMGLGKSLQTIALLYTMLRKDAPYPKIAKKGIIVAPSSLLNNWKEELRKWLGPVRLCPALAGGLKKDLEKAIKLFENGNSSVLIISYDSFRNYSQRLNKTCEIIVCDEGHRLKNAMCKTTRALAELKCEKRILLTGTPLQNSLSEFYTCVNFVNPSILGTLQTFTRLYTEPILKAQDPSCPVEVKELAWGRSAELSRLTSEFILRRTGGLLASILPKRHEFVLFTKLNKLQENLYREYLKSSLVWSTVEGGNTKTVLPLLMDLRKIVTHPDLIVRFAPKSTELVEVRQNLGNLFPPGYTGELDKAVYSPKFEFLRDLARQCIDIGDRIVVVSNFTRTLDIISEFCVYESFSFVRLDGATALKQRMKMVHRFNSPENGPLMFLLSSKAGGCGLNLIGGNRLVLLDPDWNPSNDKQAMARIWRDGQTKEVFIYRLIATGTIEEKIFQRQIAKEDLSSIIVDSKKGSSSFSTKCLKEIFSLSSQCLTFEESDDFRHDQVLGPCLKPIELVKNIQPEWTHEVLEEELDFSEAQDTLKRPEET